MNLHSAKPFVIKKCKNRNFTVSLKHAQTVCSGRFRSNMQKDAKYEKESTLYFEHV